MYDGIVGLASLAYGAVNGSLKDWKTDWFQVWVLGIQLPGHREPLTLLCRVREEDPGDAGGEGFIAAQGCLAEF